MNTSTHFDKEKFTVIISVDRVDDALRPILDIIEMNGFRIKKEFHITLIGFARGRDIKAAIERQKRNLDDSIVGIQRLIERSMITPQIRHEWYYIKKEMVFKGKPTEYRESIIAMVDIPEINQLWNELQELIGETLEPPFLHITLATRGAGSEQAWDGIGIKDLQDFESLDKEKIER